MKYLSTKLIAFIFIIPIFTEAQVEYFWDGVNRLDSISANGYSYKFTYDSTGNRMSTDIEANGIQLQVKAYLQGAYNISESLMSDHLRSSGFLPTSEPYSGLGYTHTGDGGTEEVHPVVFLTEGNDAIVDWLILELRDKNNHETVLASKSVLVQRDGDLVAVGGISSIIFPTMNQDEYFVALRHRNHLGTMTANPISLSGDATSTNIDFTIPTTATYGVDSQKNLNGVMVMWSGNAKSDDNYVRATPHLLPPPLLASDITYILDDILNGDPNATFDGYSTGDVNMDGKVRMTPQILPPPGIPSDATFILDDVLNGNPNLTRQEQFN